MNFAALPPEINSGLMYAGPGSGPMRSAAAAWGGLAAELHSAATSYETVISELTGAPWLGPSAAAMAAAAAPYVAWMSATAGQAEQAAAQAGTAVAAYEAAFAATVPPSVIAANRAQLMLLVATNLLGQNTAAIAATEAHYGEMWAQDAATMYGYAASSAGASRLAPFATPPHSSNPAGSAGQGASTAAAGGTSTMSAALQAVAAPAQAGPIINLEDLLGVSPTAVGTAALGAGLAGGAWWEATLDSEEILATQDEISVGQNEILHAIAATNPPLTLASAGSGELGGSSAPVTGSMGRAVSVGKLSVPSSWAVAAPEIRAVAYALPASSVAAAPAALAGSSGTAFSEMALAGMAGRALAGTVSPGRPPRVAAIACERPKSPQSPPDSPMAGIASDLREFAALRDAGILTDKEFSGLKQRLLGL